MQTSYTAIFESNSATCICDHCSFLQPRDDKVVDSVEKHPCVHAYEAWTVPDTLCTDMGQQVHLPPLLPLKL